MHQDSYKKYLLGVLMVILASNFLDRVALGIVLQDIKVDLQLSDTQLGFLGGIAFAIFYAVMGIPIARWADRGDRVTIITVTTALWSVTVALCGLVTSFAQLLLVRVGVAVGEAGCFPPAQSLLSDYFARSERPRAIGIYTMGAALSVVLGYFAAGWLNELYGWRATFVLIGLPGVGLALLAWFTVKEPRRFQSPQCVALPQEQSLLTTWRFLWANTTFRRMLLCLAVSHFFMYGVMQWQPAYFIRSFGLHTGQIGSWFALVAVGGLIGNYLGGMLATRFAPRNEARQMRGMAVLWCGYGALSAGVYLVSNYYLSFLLIGLASLLLAATNGPYFATIQTLVPPQMRATSVAIIQLVTNLIGMGLGPLIAGALSDAMHPWLGEESLRYSLLALSPGFLWCVWQMLRASKSVAADLAHAEGEADRTPGVIAAVEHQPTRESFADGTP